MNSERIKTLASFVNKEDVVLDVGCDHGYLSIYLKKNNLCKNVYASDISENALNSAINNFKKYNVKIKSFQSDGFNSVNEEFNTAVIAGMGTSTIINILNNEKKPDKIILSSNNELYKLRCYLNKNGYKIEEEKCVYENNHYYIIMLVKKGYQKLSKKYLKYGLVNDKNYFLYLLNKNKKIIKNAPCSKKIKLLYENHIIKKFI